MVWLTSDPTFSVDLASVAMTGLRYTDPAQARTAMRLVGDVHPATVVISTRSLEDALERLPTVASAQVRAVLPDQLTVAVTERQPILAWRTGDAAWLMDVDGNVFAPTSSATQDELGDGASGSALPAVDDLRTAVSLHVGDRLDPVNLEAVRTLGSVTPDMVGSSALALFLSLDDDDGWVLTSPGHWRAIFGHYTQTLAPASRIAEQVQCLGALLGDAERTVDVVTLAVGSGCGTYVSGTPEPRARRTPRPDATRRPNKTARP